jgi:glycosyltransferase involved in cell wall biosynthesis
MDVLVVSAVFPPEPLVSARTSYQIAEALVEGKHSVRVLTSFPSRPAGKLYPGYKRHLFQRQRDAAGFETVRCFSIPSARSDMFSRFLENIAFGLSGGLAALLSPRADVLYANTWPIAATALLFLVSKLRRIPMVISVQDVYPESLVAQRRIRSSALSARGMRWLDGTIAKGCQAVIVISDRFADLYRVQRRVQPDRVHVIPNWVESDWIDLKADAGRFREANKIPADAFVVAYGGNVGAAAGVETVIEAWSYLEDLEGLYLVIAGEGSRLEACRELARSTGGRISFCTPWPVEDTSRLLRAADLLVLPTRGEQSLASVPSKLITYMLAARPVLAVALPESETAKTISRAECGWVVAPDQPELLARMLRKVMHMDASARRRRGRAGRTFALNNLTHVVCLPRVLDILAQAAG